MGALRLKPRFYDRERPKRGLRRLTRKAFNQIFSRWPLLSVSPIFKTLLLSRMVGDDSFQMFDAIFAVTGAKFLVDSSKDPFRMRYLYEHDPSRVVVVMLGRDYRGTVHSKMKRGRELVSSIRGWAARMNRMNQMVDGIPAKKIIRVKYEDLCANPKRELERICNWLEIEFAVEMMTRPSASMHHLGGSPSKFDPSKKAIEIDQTYLTAFTDEQLRTMKEIAGSTATEWGYD